MSEETKPETEAVEAVKQLPAGFFTQLLLDRGYGVEAAAKDAHGVETLYVPSEDALAIAAILRDDSACQFDFMVSVTGLDLRTHRESVYHLQSLNTGKALVLKIKANASDHSPSLYSVWPAVDWHEREAYDLLGIIYEGHPDLRRILMPTYWLGHPLRKDYKEEDPRLVWNKR
jgi:NADH-quinone oxidoreductase subunit C